MANKKGSVGETLTWMIAFIIIVVLMGSLIFYTGFIAVKKKVSFEDKNEILYDVRESTNSLRILESFLIEDINDEGEKIKIKDSIKKWAYYKNKGEESSGFEYRENVLLTQYGKVLEKYPGECKIFYASYGDLESNFNNENNLNAYDFLNKEEIIIVVNENINWEGISPIVYKNLKRINPTSIYVEDSLIQIKLYSSVEKC